MAGNEKERQTDLEERQRRPKPPFPAQHQPKPGNESALRPKPSFEAPAYLPAGKLVGRNALVTGGDSGIGRAVAYLYAREGADVAIVYTPAEQRDAEITVEAVRRQKRRALLLPGDVTDPDFCRSAVQHTVDTLGGIDILVNNAAFQQHQPDLPSISDEQWDRTFRTNIYGYFYMAREAVRHLQPGSAIINVSSITGLEGNKQLLDYSSTKGAINAFTKALAQNLVPKGIRVNAIAPGPVWTPLNPSDSEAEAIVDFGADVPMKRPAQPDEIAPACVFLASAADSGYITGEVLTLLGGQTIA